jgi:hypothetical protein
VAEFVQFRIDCHSENVHIGMSRLQLAQTGQAGNNTDKLDLRCAVALQEPDRLARAVSSGKHWIDKNDLGERRGYNIPAFSYS